MKRHQFLRHLANHGCKLYREGTNHSLYYNPKNGEATAVARHTEIDNKLCNKICKDLGIPKIP